MAMPSSIKLVNQKTGHEKVLEFSHALRLLRLEQETGANTHKLKGKFLFDGKDIIRKRNNKDSTSTQEQG